MDIEMVKEKIMSVDKKIMYGASIITILAVIAIGYGLFGQNGRSAAPTAEPVIKVTTVTVEPSHVDSVISATGALASKNTSVLSSKVMGRVAALTVEEGDYVSRGKLLIRIDSGEISAQAYQAQAAYNNARLHYDRIKSLFDQNAATQMEMDQATLGYESAKAGLDAAKAMESYTTITAPIAGQVIEKRINLGEMALPGQPILKIEDNRTLRLDVTMKEQDIRFAKVGNPVAVQIDALPGKEIKGRVAQVVQASDIRTHSFIVKIDIPADKSLITGMYGKAFFSIGKRETVLIPQSALVQMSGLTGVYIVNGEGNAVFQMVQLGEAQGTNVEARTGLKAGDKVIVSTHHEAMDGKKVLVAQSRTGAQGAQLSSSDI
jgi:RND family efflux transporter MFP subunit